mgnify:CR=1 FL=1
MECGEERKEKRLREDRREEGRKRGGKGQGDRRGGRKLRTREMGKTGTAKRPGVHGGHRLTTSDVRSHSGISVLLTCPPRAIDRINS